MQFSICNCGARLGWTLIGLAAAWFLLHLGFYIARICHLDPAVVRESCHELKHFFCWQAVGFFAVAIVGGLLRPTLAARALGGYLLASTVALLAASHNAGLVSRVLVLLLWAFCAVNGMRGLIARAAGPRYATWGVAAGAVMAALVPLGFLLGILHAITPSNVTALAVLSALPGAVLMVRRLFNLCVKPRPVVADERRSCRILLPGRTATTGRGFTTRSFTVFRACCLEAVWMALAISFVGASTSEVHSDAVRVHLPYIHQVVWDHGISHQYACWHRLQPMAMQTCGAMFAAVGGDAAAKWLSWLVLAALALVVADEVHRRSGSPALGALGAAAALGCPVLIGLATTVYVDHAMALLCTAGFVVLFRALSPLPSGEGQGVRAAVARGDQYPHPGPLPKGEGTARSPSLRGILLSAVIMASMAQIKYPGLVFCVVWGVTLCAALLWQLPWRVALRWSLAGGVVLAAAMCPWYIYVYLGTGNPVFPYLQNWFHSPYWIDGFSPQQVYEASFKLDSGILGALRFPWIGTFYTHRFVEGYDGYVGFWVLALAPCCLLPLLLRQIAGARNATLARSASEGRHEESEAVHFFPYWDMALSATAMIALVVSYTPYVRYWLPAYPLLLAACVLAAGPLVISAWQRLVDRRRVGQAERSPTTGRRIPGGTALRLSHPTFRSTAEVFAGLTLTALLLFPVVLPCPGFSWDEYAGHLSPEVRKSWAFPGHETVEQLNPILTLDDGVIVTGYEGNHLIAGRAYEFPFWWCDLRRIHDVPAMADFCRRYHIRYWLVNHDGPMSRIFCGREQIAAHYWTDARLVTARGTTAVYDVTGPSARLVKSAAADLSGGPVAVTGREGIGYDLKPQSAASICRVKLDLSSDGQTAPLLEVVWRDAPGNIVGHTTVPLERKSDCAACLFVPVPPGVKSGRVQICEPRGLPFRLRRAEVTYWRPATAAEMARQLTRNRERL